MNRNALLNFLSLLYHTIGTEVFRGPMFTNFVFLSFGSFTAIGVCETLWSVGGICAVPVARFADTHRNHVIRYGVLLGFVSHAFLAYAVLQRSFILILFGTFLDGFSEGATGPAVYSLLTDSLATGKRTTFNTVLFGAEQMSSALSPLSAVLFLHFFGSTQVWDAGHLGKVIVASIGASAVGSLLMLGMDEKYALGEESEAYTEIPEEGEESAESKKRFWEKSSFLIPFLLLVQSTLFMVGAGLSIIYLPVYFNESVGMTPLQLNILICCTHVFTAILSWIAHHLEKKLGAVTTVVASTSVSIAALIGMTMSANVAFLSVAFCLRQAFTRATEPIENSLNMDYTPKNVRATWAAVHSVNLVVLSAVSIAGGKLIDAYGMHSALLCTAAAYSGANLIFSVIGRCAGVTKGPLSPKSPIPYDAPSFESALAALG